MVNFMYIFFTFMRLYDVIKNPWISILLLFLLFNWFFFSLPERVNECQFLSFFFPLLLLISSLTLISWGVENMKFLISFCCQTWNQKKISPHKNIYMKYCSFTMSSMSWSMLILKREKKANNTLFLLYSMSHKINY